MDHTCLKGQGQLGTQWAGLGGAGPRSTTKWRSPLRSYWPEMQSPEVATVLKPHSPEIGSFQLPPETGKLLTARGRLPARGDSFAKSNGGFQGSGFLFWNLPATLTHLKTT